MHCSNIPCGRPRTNAYSASDRQNTVDRITTGSDACGGPAGSLFAGAILQTTTTLAQETLWLEEFDGGTTTTGFTVDNNVSDCYWVYAPDSVHPGMTFNQDFGDLWPAGPGFDSSFVFLDSDECGGTGVTVNSFLNSPTFDTSPLGGYTLNFSHQFKARLQSFIHIDVWNGLAWTEVYHHTGSNVGFPNPAVTESIDITSQTGGSAAAQVRFQFCAGWDWWWALDSISIVHDASVGQIEQANPEFGVFPNPATDVLHVGRYPAGTTNIHVYNAIGDRVRTWNPVATLEVGMLTPGVYVVEAIDRSGRSLGPYALPKGLIEAGSCG
ncbi:MAG: T9SS type A sorting domain-containing protein [Flavobacteriales bacterium]